MKKNRISTNQQDGENHLDNLSSNDNEFAEIRQFSDYEAEIDSYIADNKLHELRNVIKKVDEKFKKTEIKVFLNLKQKTYVYAIAATIILLVGIFGIIKYVANSSRNSNIRLFTEFYQPYESNYIQRSDQVTVNNLYLAFQAYENHEYEKAIGLFTKVIDADESIIIAYFYKGISCIETNNLAAAIESFNKVLINELNPYYPQAKWYMALTLIKLNNIVEAKQHLTWLASNDRFYGKKAKELLSKLK